MEDRRDELSKLQSFISRIDTELTMILQHLQWDRKIILEGTPMVDCRLNENHKVPESRKCIHEQKCMLTHHGYSEEDILLPDPLDTNANTFIKLNKLEINQIINRAAQADPSLKKGNFSTQGTDSTNLEPLTLGRLQVEYTPDERRAIHEHVVSTAPSCHDLSDLALPSEGGETSASSKHKSRAEILAELRDMKRRRTRYRVPAKTRNYSDVLRDVIKTQMEVYSDVKIEEADSSVLPPRQENSKKLDDKYLSSKEFRNASYKRANESENNSNSDRRHITDESRHKYNEDKSRLKYNKDESSSGKKRRTDDVIQYPDPRYYKHDRYSNDGSSSRKSRNYGYDGKLDSERRNYNDRKYKEERLYRDHRERSDALFVEIKKEPESESEDYNDKKYRDGDRSKHRHRVDEREHRSDRDERQREHKRDSKYGHRSKESTEYEESKAYKHRKGSYADRNSGRERKDDKDDYKRRSYDHNSHKYEKMSKTK